MSKNKKRKIKTAESDLKRSRNSDRPPDATTARASDRPWRITFVCLFLAAAVWTVFGQTVHYGFVNYDDDDYVYQNALVRGGLTPKGISWAFTHVHSNNWHPLTSISHMIDCQFYGLWAGGHHLTNVLLHAVAVILLFLVLREMTSALWPSAFVAAVFAIHPLRVESVAWISERKDVLSGLFFMLTLWAYVRYTRHPRSLARYLLVAFLFALGLMSKPTLVTLPFVLLLLDYWPLRRFASSLPSLAESKIENSPESASMTLSLGLEKLPLILLAAASCAATMVAQHGALKSFERVPFPSRLATAAISPVAYIGQMIVPANLAAFYPLPKDEPSWRPALALLLLGSVTAALFVGRRKYPWLLVGWLWYLGMLIPTSGLVQVGDQARADRYTYLPQIGLYLLVAFGMAGFCVRRPRLRPWLGVVAVALVAGWIAGARAQASFWRNSGALWSHALVCNPADVIAHNNLGMFLRDAGDSRDAIAQFQQALQIDPALAQTHLNLAVTLAQTGHADEAIAHYQVALEIRPRFADAHNNLAILLRQKGLLDEAISHYQQAIEIRPDFAEAYGNLGNAYYDKGRVDDAIAQFQKALEIKPDLSNVRSNLTNVLLQREEEEARSLFGPHSLLSH